MAPPWYCWIVAIYTAMDGRFVHFSVISLMPVCLQQFPGLAGCPAVVFCSRVGAGARGCPCALLPELQCCGGGEAVCSWYNSRVEVLLSYKRKCCT